MNESRRPAAVYRVELYREGVKVGLPGQGKTSLTPGDAELRLRLGQLEEQLRRLLDAAVPVSRTDGSHSAIPWRERAIGAEEVGELLAFAPRTVLERVACRPDFPVRLTMRPATWVAGEVLRWRDTHRED